MTKEIEALETLDEYSDEQYSAFLEYTALKQYYNIDFNVPLDTELKIGYDWLNMKEVK